MSGEVRQGEAEVRSGEVEVSPREVEPHIHKCCPGFAIPASSLAIVWLFALPQGEIPLYIFKVFELPLLLDDQRFLCDVPNPQTRRCAMFLVPFSSIQGLLKRHI